MVGAGALREALNAPEVGSVLSIGRHPCGVEHPKLRTRPEWSRALIRRTLGGSGMGDLLERLLR